MQLNGQNVGTLICPSFEVVPAGRFQTTNTLTESASNLLANRAADMDRTGQEWKNVLQREPSHQAQGKPGADGLFTAAAW